MMVEWDYMSWHLTQTEAADLEARVIKQLCAEAQKIIDANPTISNRALLYRLMQHGYSAEELCRLKLCRLNDTIKVC